MLFLCCFFCWFFALSSYGIWFENAGRIKRTRFTTQFLDAITPPSRQYSYIEYILTFKATARISRNHSRLKFRLWIHFQIQAVWYNVKIKEYKKNWLPHKAKPYSFSKFFWLSYVRALLCWLTRSAYQCLEKIIK